MDRLSSASAMWILGLLCLGSTLSAQEGPREVTDRAGNVIAVLGSQDVTQHLPRPAEPSAAEAAPECPPSGQHDGQVFRESRRVGSTVDACGRVWSDSGRLLRGVAGARQGGSVAAAVAGSATIDQMSTSISYGNYAPGGTITLLGGANIYQLSDGTQWQSGAGSFAAHWAQLVRVEVAGSTIRYVLSPPEVGLLYEQTDFDSGDHSAQGKLGAAGDLVIEAQSGSTTAVLRGNALVVSNDITGYGEPRFNYYDAVVGSVVPFEMVYTIAGATWAPDTFTRSFNYSGAGRVDFAHPVSTPRPVELSITGPSRIPDEFTTSYVATVRYEGGALRDVTATAGWTVEPASVAGVAAGVLTIGKIPTSEQAFTLRASFVQGADSLLAEKQIRCLADDPAEKPGTWPMFQANAKHTGYLPLRLNPATFRLRWQKNIASRPLNPVTAGDGKVFVSLLTYFSDEPSLFALRARDGATLWSKGFGSIFSVNPPSYAYGNVYLQTGNNYGDTWLRAFEGETGGALFQAPHAAQWERYYAPTLYQGKAYVDGGSYGGMYSFDAYTGAQLWFTSLPQYDQWTPAVDGDRAFAYVGNDYPGLYTKDRLSGVPAPNFVADPHFKWDGWSMNLAPVVGAHGDVLAIHDGRLISFDPASGTIRWEVPSLFAGQPSVANDRIYAIDGGRLVVLDELTHAELWSWRAPDGDLSGPMILTDTHLFVSTRGSVHAVDLVGQQSAWSFPAGGSLAMADDTLYVASTTGTLTAIATPGPSSFYTLPACRVVDTRAGSGAPIGGPALVGTLSRVLPIAGNCGVPATAKAVSVNVTVTDPQASGNLRLSPALGSVPTASTINYVAGQTRANNAVIALNDAGQIAAFAGQLAGTTVNLIVDVNGYFQ